MKTIKLILLALGFVCFNTAFSFTALNLPYDQLTTLKKVTPLSFDNTKEVINVVVPDKTGVINKNLKDTILIDLSNDEVIDAFPSASRDCIMKQIPYPDFAYQKHLEGGVTVRFKFNDQGNISVLESCSNSPELEQYVVARMESLQLKNCVADMNKDYYLRFMFRLF